jgi:hypothetical protein
MASVPNGGLRKVTSDAFDLSTRGELDDGPADFGQAAAAETAGELAGRDGEPVRHEAGEDDELDDTVLFR